MANVPSHENDVQDEKDQAVKAEDTNDPWRNQTKTISKCSRLLLCYSSSCRFKPNHFVNKYDYALLAMNAS
jgi:hypothetical protein